MLIWYGHGNNAWLPIETYPVTPAGRQAAINALLAYEASYGAANVGWADAMANPARPLKSYQVGLTVQGVAKLWSGDNTLVVLAVCHGTNLANAFLSAGAGAVLYWPNYNYSVATASQVQGFFSRMDGTKYPDAGLNDGRLRTTANAWSDCQGTDCACPSGGSCNPMALSSKVALTLAPAVTDRKPDPEMLLPKGTVFTVHVGFDTHMMQNDPTSVVTLKGCATPVDPLKWNGNAIEGTFMASDSALLTITVHSDQAVSVDNGNVLDGNQVGGSNDTPVAKSGDDFVWQVSACGFTPVNVPLHARSGLRSWATHTLW